MAVFDEAPECFILSLNTQADMGTGSSQYNFAQQKLAAAKNQDPTIDWKIVYIYYSCTSRYTYLLQTTDQNLCHAEELPPAV